MCSSECQSPPAYSGRDPSPAYSVIPRATERILEQSRRRSRTPPNGVYSKCVDNVTLLLLGQEENIERPMVRAGALSGLVLLQHTENVKSVVVTIDGLLETNPLPGSYLSIPVVKITKTLYSEGSPSSCPHNLAFTKFFPSTFRHSDGNVYPLPPTCHILFQSVLQFIKCAYRITVTVVSVRHRRTPFLTKSDSVSVDLEYSLRTRPSQPIIQNPSLFDTVKPLPEEWAQFATFIWGETDSPLMCDLFVPSVGVFCIADPIPFHLQICSPGAQFNHMHRFFGRSAQDLPVRVYILRQITADAGGRIAKRNIILGEGALRLLSAADGALNWEGQACCRDPGSVVGSFDCGPAVAVTDMLAVEILPPHGCPLKRAFFGYAIKLTTNSWDNGEERIQ
ncbi:hypothetical protein DFH09DRAFT_1138573 [Mycena vulgaris]|nr:hypothetical protein DFH09DRAFT_1138573 [Mycena vulgaris]